MRCIAIVAGMLALASLVSASPICVPGTLASYISLGAGGCMIGTNTVSNFIALSGTSGATPISTASVNITTSGGTSNPTLLFTVSQSPGQGAAVETIFDYRIAANTYTNSTLTLSGSSETGSGGVTDLQNICIGGTWGASGVTACSSGKTASLTTVDGIQNMDSSALTAAAFLSVTDDIELDGPATGAVGTDSFTATTAAPEPATWYLFAMGLAVSAFLKIKVAAVGKGN